MEAVKERVDETERRLKERVVETERRQQQRLETLLARMERMENNHQTQSQALMKRMNDLAGTL